MAIHKTKIIEKPEEEIKPLDQKKLDLIKQIEKEKETYYSQTQTLRTQWEECYKLYINHLEEADYPWLSNIFIPKTHEAIELLASFLTANNPTLRCLPQGKGDTQKAEFMSKLIAFQLDRKIKFKNKIQIWVKQGLALGTSPLKVFWRFEEGSYDDPDCEVVNLFDFYADPYVSDINDSPSVIHRIVKPIDEIKKNKNYKNTDQLISFSEANKVQDSSRLNVFDLDNSKPQESKEIEKTEIFERWTKEKLITIGRGKDGFVILREIDNPYGFIPFVLYRPKLHIIPNRLFGIGIIEPNIKIQKALNSLANQIIDNITLIINKMWIRKKGARIDPKQLISRPGGFIDVGDVNNDIRPVEISDIKPSSQVLYQLLDTEFQQGTGALNLLKGLPEADFATQVAVGQRNANVLINNFKLNLENSLEELGEKIVKLNIDNITDSRSMRVFENEKEFTFLEFEPEEINGEFDIECVADSTISRDRDVVSKQLIDFLTIASQDPNANLDRNKIYKKWLSLQGFNDIEDLFQVPQSIPQPVSPVSLPQRSEFEIPEKVIT